MGLTTINDLPAEMVCEVFRHLHPSDLAACSMVNKRWYWIYAGFKVDRLVVSDSFYFISRQWAFSEMETEGKQLCSPKAFSFLVDQSGPLISNLKSLALFENETDSFDKSEFKIDLNKLNSGHFNQLEYLEINNYLDLEELNLKFSKLKVLVLSRFNDICHISIDCPHLSVFLYAGETVEENLLDMKHPETVRKLVTSLAGPKLAQFKNVESLRTAILRAFRKETFLLLPKLTEFHYFLGFENSFDQLDNRIGSLDWIKRALKEFMKDVRGLRGLNFKFRFWAFQMTSEKLDQIDFGMQVRGGTEKVCDEYILLKNYRLIDWPDSIGCLYYNYLMSVGEEIPNSFFKKFAKINIVIAVGVVRDEEHFLWFLKSLKCLKRLRLKNVKLSQEFYDQLPLFGHSLVLLSIKSSDLHLSFDFISKLSLLPKLTKLDLEGVFSFDWLISLAKNFSNFSEGFNICFDLLKKIILICKIRGPTLYKLCDDNHKVFYKTYDADGIVSTLEYCTKGAI